MKEGIHPKYSEVKVAARGRIEKFNKRYGK